MDKKDMVGRGEKIKLSVRVAVLELCLERDEHFCPLTGA